MISAFYLGPLSELEEYGEVNGDDNGEGEQELRQAGDHGVSHLPLALPRVLPPVNPGLPCSFCIGHVSFNRFIQYSGTVQHNCEVQGPKIWLVRGFVKFVPAVV